MMKILIVNKFLYPNGGSETYIFKLGAALKALGHEVEYFGMEHEGRIVSNSAGQYTSDMDFHTSNKLTQLTYPLKTIYSKEARKKIAVVLDDFKPDVVHLNNFNYQLTPSIIYAVKDYEKKSKKKVKIIYTAHDYQLVCPNHMMMDSNGNICEDCIGGNFTNCLKKSCIHSSKAKSLVGMCEAELYKSLKTYRYIDCVICPSAFMKTKLDFNPYLKGKTVVLHNFIDEIEKKKSEKKGYVLYFGRYAKEKGIDTLLKAKDINFVFAGSGDLKDKIGSSPNVEDLGFKSGEELENLIRGALCSVYPSVWYENCPFSVMESIMYGTPVVGANIGGIPELIDEGKTGFLFEAKNVKSLEDAINKIVKNPSLAQQMQENCLNKNFDTQQTYTQKYLDIIGEL